jgi:hypothetical protein
VDDSVFEYSQQKAESIVRAYTQILISDDLLGHLAQAHRLDAEKTIQEENKKLIITKSGHGDMIRLEQLLS